MEHKKLSIRRRRISIHCNELKNWCMFLSQWWLWSSRCQDIGCVASKSTTTEHLLIKWHPKHQDQVGKWDLLQQAQQSWQNCCVWIFWWCMYYCFLMEFFCPSILSIRCLKQTQQVLFFVVILVFFIHRLVWSKMDSATSLMDDRGNN
jgi:hypothetical protein